MIMSTKQPSNAEIIPFLLDLFARRGAEEYLGEAVTMSQHMEQTAACAVANKETDAMIAAALLHDVGHFVTDLPLDAIDHGVDALHEQVGAHFLSQHFPAEVTEPIRQHVAAKKYLCAVDPEYFNLLSDASVLSLQVQGGPMTPTEKAEFESNPHYKQAVQLRKYDDDGKVIGLTIHPFREYLPLLQRLLIKAK